MLRRKLFRAWLSSSSKPSYSQSNFLDIVFRYLGHSDENVHPTLHHKFPSFRDDNRKGGVRNELLSTAFNLELYMQPTCFLHWFCRKRVLVHYVFKGIPYLHFYFSFFLEKRVSVNNFRMLRVVNSLFNLTSDSFKNLELKCVKHSSTFGGDITNCFMSPNLI
jgi:hypothetical protein